MSIEQDFRKVSFPTWQCSLLLLSGIFHHRWQMLFGFFLCLTTVTKDLKFITGPVSWCFIINHCRNWWDVWLPIPTTSVQGHIPHSLYSPSMWVKPKSWYISKVLGPLPCLLRRDALPVTLWSPLLYHWQMSSDIEI